MASLWTLPIFQDVILPFVLIFTLIFAVLQKSKLLGEGKQQIDAIIAFVIAGVLIASAKYVLWIKQFTLFLIVTLFIIFVFMLIYGFIAGAKSGDPFENLKWMKYVLGIIVFVALVIAVLVITGNWDRVKDFFTSSETGTNVLFVIIIVIAIVAVLFGSGKSGGSKT